VLLTAVRLNLESITDASQMFWSLIEQLGGNYGLALFQATQRNGWFSGASFDAQAQALSSPDADPCPIPGTPDITRVIYSFGQDILHFITGDHTNYQYVPFIQRFTGGRKEKAYSAQFFISTFRIFGPHAALYLDFVLIRFIAEGVSSILKTYQQLTKETESVRASGNSDSLARYLQDSRLIEASKTFLSVAVALTLRLLVRRASENVVNETVPGLAELILSQSGTTTPATRVVKEVFGSVRSSFFIIEQLRKTVTQRFTQALPHYFFFVAGLFGNPNWKNAAFYVKQDALENNLHILPYAWEILCDVVLAFFDKNSEADIREGLDAFFGSLSHVINVNDAGNNKPVKPYLILVDKFTKLIPELEYGYVEKYFPYASVALGYPQTVESQGSSVPRPGQ
jgi:hypothetical protein